MRAGVVPCLLAYGRYRPNAWSKVNAFPAIAAELLLKLVVDHPGGRGGRIQLSTAHPAEPFISIPIRLTIATIRTHAMLLTRRLIRSLRGPCYKTEAGRAGDSGRQSFSKPLPDARGQSARCPPFTPHSRLNAARTSSNWGATEWG